MSANFHEVQFPPLISYGAIGGPGFNTSIFTASSGYEQRNINWSKTRGKWDVAQGLKTDADFNTLLKFFFARNGRAYGFRFKDWTDYMLPFWVDAPGDTDPLPVVFTTDGSTATFQLTKPYGDTANTFVRPIYKPVVGSLFLFDNTSPFSDWTVDYTTGIVTLTGSVPVEMGHQITAACQFDTPARFDVDELRNSLEQYDANTWGQIPIVEIRDI